MSEQPPVVRLYMGNRLVPSLSQQQQSTRYILPEVGSVRQPSQEGDELIPQIPPTGHYVQYMSYGMYYGTMNRGPRSTLLTPYSTAPPRRR